MKKVFVGGSRRISRLNEDVRRRIDEMIQRRLQILVGDANGADKAIQLYLDKRQYPNVVVFCTSGECRNNLADWPVSSVKPPHNTRDFTFYTAKDSAMAREADYGLMLWDGRSTGTMVNVARMVAACKPVVVYISATKEFFTLKSRFDFDQLLSLCASGARSKINAYVSEHASELSSTRLF